MEKLGVAIRGMYKTIKFPYVWKPSLYMYLSIALSISTHEGTFYWYTDPKAGPAFSQVSPPTLSNKRTYFELVLLQDIKITLPSF